MALIFEIKLHELFSLVGNKLKDIEEKVHARSWQMLKWFVFITIIDIINCSFFERNVFIRFWNSVKRKAEWKEKKTFAFVRLFNVHVMSKRRGKNNRRCLHVSEMLFIFLSCLVHYPYFMNHNVCSETEKFTHSTLFAQLSLLISERTE